MYHIICVLAFFLFDSPWLVSALMKVYRWWWWWWWYSWWREKGWTYLAAGLEVLALG